MPSWLTFPCAEAVARSSRYSVRSRDLDGARVNFSSSSRSNGTARSGFAVEARWPRVFHSSTSGHSVGKSPAASVRLNSLRAAMASASIASTRPGGALAIPHPASSLTRSEASVVSSPVSVVAALDADATGSASTAYSCAIDARRLPREEYLAKKYRPPQGWQATGLPSLVEPGGLRQCRIQSSSTTVRAVKTALPC